MALQSLLPFAALIDAHNCTQLLLLPSRCAGAKCRHFQFLFASLERAPWPTPSPLKSVTHYARRSRQGFFTKKPFTISGLAEGWQSIPLPS